MGKKIAEMYVQIGADTSDFDKKMDGVGTKFAAVGKKLSAVGKQLTIGVTLPLVAIGGAALKTAMDAVESENLFEVSMKGMADSARKWSEKLRDELGLNSYEVRKNVATFNVMLNSMGLGEVAAYDMAKGLTQLSYDMASFYNLKPEEAFQKLQAGISGEIEPLKRLGILVNENTIKHYALKTGMIEQGQVMTEQQKIMARYGAITEQTTDAQGDLARTLDSPTNKLRILKSRITELMVEIGQKLIPVFVKILDEISKAVTWFSNLSDGTKTLIVKIGGLAAAIGPALMIFGKLLIIIPKMGLALKALSGPIGIVTAGLALIAAKAIEARKEFKLSMDLYQKEMDLTGKKTGWFEKTLGSLSTAYDKIFLGIDTNRIALQGYEEAQRKANGVLTIATGVTTGLTAAKGFLVEKFQALVDVLPKVEEEEETVNEQIKYTVTLAETAAQNIGILTSTMGDFAYVTETTQNVLDNLRPIMTAVWEEPIPKARELTGVFENAQTELKDGLLPATKTVATEVKSIWADVTERMKDLWASNLGDMLSGAKTLKEGLGAIWDGIRKMFFDMVAKMVVKWVMGFAENLISSTVKAAGSVTGNLTKTATDLISKVGSWSPGGIVGNIITGAVAGLFSGLMSQAAQKQQNKFLQEISEHTWHAKQLLQVDYKVEVHVIQNLLRDIFSKAEGMCEKLDASNKRLNSIIDAIEDLPQAQHGGVFTRPTITRIAEKEPEIVIPQSKFGAFMNQANASVSGGGGGGNQVIFHIHALDGADVERVVEKKIIPKLNRLYQGNYGGYTRRLSEEIRKF